MLPTMAGLFGVLPEGGARHGPGVGGASVGRRRKGNLLHVLGGSRLLDLGELLSYCFSTWCALLMGVLVMRATFWNPEVAG